MNETGGELRDQGSRDQKSPRAWRRLWSASSVPLAAIVLALGVGSIIILASSSFVTGAFDPTLPARTYISLLVGAFGSLNGLVNVVVAATPLILGGLAVGLGFKAGVFNIGVQGQFLMGALAAAALGAALAGSPAIVAIAGALFGGAAVGAAYGFVPGALKVWTGAHEVVTTIMLNFIAGSIIAVLISAGPLGVPGFSFARTGDIGNAQLPLLIGRNGHLGIILAFAAVPAMMWLLRRTTLGFEIRAVGLNPHAARYAGMRPGLLIILVMSMSGSLAGLAGAGQILGISHFMTAPYGTSVGFDSISVALLGRAHPLGIMFAALLFGAMRSGAGLMQIEAGIPVQIIDVLQAVILLFLAADVVVRRIFRMRGGRGPVDELQTITQSYGEQAPK